MNAPAGARHSGAVARSLLALVLAMLLSGALLLVTARPAAAHEQMLTASEPPASATLSAPPDRVVLHFRWRVRQDSATVTVVGPDGRTQWQRGTAGTAERSIGVDLRELGQVGTYQVRYAAQTGRGYPFHGAVSFTLATTLPNSPLPTTHLPLSWIAAVVLLTAVGTVVGVRLGSTRL